MLKILGIAVVVALAGLLLAAASKLMGMVVDMDKMVGGAFESGLARFKAKAEKHT